MRIQKFIAECGVCSRRAAEELVAAGKIMVKLSAYPIKNYATNHLYVTGSNGESGGVDWGSKSAVETRSDSFTYTSSSEEVFTIDFYETVNWQVEFFRYQ